MAIPIVPANILSDIITYVRRLIKSPSDQAVPDNLIMNYINRFYTYDFPARIQTFELKSRFSFETSPNIDQYDPPYDANGNLMYQNILNPAYCDGAQIALTCSRTAYFNNFGRFLTNEFDAVGTGASTYTLATTRRPLARGHVNAIGNLDSSVYVSATDITNTRMVIQDNGTFDPLNDNIGNMSGDGTGTVDYINGGITVTFGSPVPPGNQIEVQYYNYNAGRPVMALFYDNVITLRSIPDRSYLMEFDAYLTPSAFLATADPLKFGYMSEYIARGAARKMLSDSGDYDQFAFYEPLFKEQEILVLRRSERQWSIDRTPTIFSQSSNQTSFNNSQSSQGL